MAGKSTAKHLVGTYHEQAYAYIIKNIRLFCAYVLKFRFFCAIMLKVKKLSIFHVGHLTALAILIKWHLLEKKQSITNISITDVSIVAYNINVGNA